MACTAGSPQPALAQVRGVLTTTHPDLAVVEIGTYDHHMAYELSDSRMYSGMAGVFSLFGLALACLGIYIQRHQLRGALSPA